MRVEINRRGIDELIDSRQMRAQQNDAADAVARNAIDLTPRRTGRMARSIKVLGDGDDGAVRVGSTHPFFHLVEWGSVHNIASAPLRRAVERVGLRKVETRR